MKVSPLHTLNSSRQFLDRVTSRSCSEREMISHCLENYLKTSDISETQLKQLWCNIDVVILDRVVCCVTSGSPSVGGSEHNPLWMTREERGGGRRHCAMTQVVLQREVANIRWENRGMILWEESSNTHVKCQRFIVLFTSLSLYNTNQECEKDVRMENFTQLILLVAAENDLIHYM